MLAIAIQDVAIARAHEAGTLKTSEHTSRFGSQYWAVADDHGTIEIFFSETEMTRAITNATKDK